MAAFDNPGSSLTCGRKTVTTGGTAEALSSTATSISEVTITAETDNTGYVVVGNSSVVASLATRKGTPLSAGQTITLAVNNLTKVYLDVTVNGDGVTYTAIVP